MSLSPKGFKGKYRWKKHCLKLLFFTFLNKPEGNNEIGHDFPVKIACSTKNIFGLDISFSTFLKLTSSLGTDYWISKIYRFYSCLKLSSV